MPHPHFGCDMQADGKSPQTFTVEDRGCHLTADICGDGPPVVLIQGVGVHGSGWRPQVEALSERYRCLSFDNRGLGRSQPAGIPLSIEQMAEDALRIMDSQFWPSAHVVGHSMGGLIALHLALSRPERVRTLSLLCTFARGRDATRLSPWMLWVGLRTRIGTRRQRRNAFLKLVCPPDTLRSSDRDALALRLAPLFGHDLADQPAITTSQLRAMSRYDATSELHRIGIPTLVVSARHDHIARPVLGRALADGIAGARFVEIENASHGVPLEQPKIINDLLRGHFALHLR